MADKSRIFYMLDQQELKDIEVTELSNIQGGFLTGAAIAGLAIAGAGFGTGYYFGRK